MAAKKKTRARRRNVAARGASSAKQYGAAQAVLSGLSKIMPRAVAQELVSRTSHKKRQAFARALAKKKRNPGYDSIRPGSRVTIVNRFGQKQTGRAVMHGPAGWVLNLGGRHGTPGIADASNTVKVSAGKAARGAGYLGAKRNPKKKARRKNQEDNSLRAAEHMFKKFHGRPASRVEVVEQLRVSPDALADCGRLVELIVDTGAGGRRLPFKGGVRVGTTGDGGQLYFLKGDQAPDLSKFPGIRLPKDHLDLGELVSIVYFTSKDFHNFEPSEYEHVFGTDDAESNPRPRGRRPTLHFDVHSKRLYLTGGTYRVKRAGIVG